ncbi:MAG: hypothetical protein CMD29_05535 [Flavobacteriales bacterium]|nr:hypothetical protein [Flavobacteriales bacterium]
MIFTDIERDRLLREKYKILEKLKTDWILGLHHNYWVDNKFIYNPVFDFSIATKDDLVELNGINFPQFRASCVNFNDNNLWRFNDYPKHWDVLNIAKDVEYKNNMAFVQAVRKMYNLGFKRRVLFIVSTEFKKTQNKNALYQSYLKYFSSKERQLFNLILIDSSSPAFDFKTLSIFYNNAKIFCSTSLTEHRPRLPSYAITCGLPIVVSSSVSTLFPVDLRKEPYVFTVTKGDFSDQIIKAINFFDSPDYSEKIMRPSIEEFSEKQTVLKFNDFLIDNFKTSLTNSNFNNLGLRLARHIGFNDHLVSSVGICMDDFLQFILKNQHEILRKVILSEDPELYLKKMNLVTNYKFIKSKIKIKTRVINIILKNKFLYKLNNLMQSRFK